MVWRHWTRKFVSSSRQNDRAQDFISEPETVLYSFSSADHEYTFVHMCMCIDTCMYVRPGVHGLWSCLVSVAFPFN